MRWGQINICTCTVEIHFTDLDTPIATQYNHLRNRLLRIPHSSALRHRILNPSQKHPNPPPSPLLQQNLNPRSRRHNRRIAKRQFSLGVRELEIVFREEMHEELLHHRRGVPAPGTI